MVQSQSSLCGGYKLALALLVIVLFLSAVTLPPRSVLAETDAIQLAVDTANFNQDGLLVLFGKLRQQGEIGLPVSAGDVNGDGRADVIFCGMFGSSFPRINNGVVNFYVSDGRDSGFVDTALDPPNFSTLAGQRTGDLLGTSVSAYGDVNGDGLRDVAVAAALHDGQNSNRFNAGAVYVVPGSPNFHLNLDLATIDGNPPPGVIGIYGPQVDGRMGIWVDEGDVDGDGFADIVIGSDQMNSGLQHVGGAYIVFGAPSLPSVIDLASPPPGVRTAKIVGPNREDHWGAALQVGDINNDGIGDVIIGGSIFRDSGSYVTPTDDTGHDGRGASFGGLRPGCGEAFVIYGQQNWPAETLLANPPATATHVIGAKPLDLLGSQVHSGDLNGDGRTDLIVGALQANAPDGKGNTGGVFIVYGAPGIVGATIDLADPVASGLQVTSIFGEAAFDCAGDSVRTFDINKDGMSDLFIGSPEHTFELNGDIREDAGDTKVIFGQPGFLPPLVKLYDPPPGLEIFRLAGAKGEGGIFDGDEFSYRLSGGDVDGDGFFDYISNAMHGDGFNQARTNAGNVYVFSGKKLSARLGKLPADQAPTPVLQSATLLSAGQPVQEAPAGQAGLRVTITGTGFRPDTEIQINSVAVFSRAPDDSGQAATQRTVFLDENPIIRNSAGLLLVRARNTLPSPSGLSNQVSAGRLVGLEITQLKVKRKSNGILLLKITGTNFPSGAGVAVTSGGTPLVLKSVSQESSTFIQAKVRASSVPPSGSQIQVRVTGPGGIQSNEVTGNVP